MSSSLPVDALLEYTRIAASTLRDIPSSKNVPFLSVVSQVTMQIIPMVQVSTLIQAPGMILTKVGHQGKSRSLYPYDRRGPPSPLYTDLRVLRLGIYKDSEIPG
jgi:hypothetical protein